MKQMPEQMKQTHTFFKSFLLIYVQHIYPMTVIDATVKGTRM